MSQALVKIENVSAFIPGDAARRLVLRNITLCLDEHTAIMGANGAGKSSLMRLAHGDLRPCAGNIAWFEHDRWTSSAIAAKELAALVSPQIQAQCQLHAWDVTGLQLLAGAANNAPMAFAAEPDADSLKNITALLAKMAALPLLDMRLPQLSQGQLRLLLLARALLARPKLLLLDEWADGLDEDKRSLLADVLKEYAKKMLMVFTGHRQDVIPDWVEKRLYLQDGRLYNEPRADGAAKQLNCQTAPQEIWDKPEREKDSEARASEKMANPACGALLISLKNASVYIDGEPVLRGINWQLRKGEHWHLAGANGSGKSTLLRLLAGDEFVAAGGSLAVYSAKSGQAIRTLEQKRRAVSLVSDLGQALYGYALTARELVLSGCDMSVGNYREFTEAEKQRAEALLALFFGAYGWPEIAGRSIRQVSSGQLRRLFLARALMPGPEILLLDEPCSGLDAQSRAAYLELLGKLAQGENGPQIVLASHYEEDVPAFVNKKARMTDGRLSVE